MATLAGHTKAAPVGLTRAVGIGIAVLFLGLLVVEWLPWAQQGAPLIGIDFALYRDVTIRWLGGGAFYQPAQVAGPYVVSTLTPGAVLYPPPFLLLVAPFAVLPAVLWYAIPLGVTTWIVAWHRPSPISWAGIAVCLWFPTTGIHLIHGNPFLWTIMLVALATRWPFFGPFVLLKPTLAPFALVGITHRAWWTGLAVFALACAVFLPMWPDYLAVIRNAQDPGGIGYSLQQAPAMMIPVLAWLGTTRRAATPAGSGSVLSRLRLSARASG